MSKRRFAGIMIIAFVILLSMTLVYSSAFLTDMDKKDSIVLKSAKLKNEIAVELLQNHIDSTSSTATMAFTLTNESNVAIKNSIQITANFDMSNSGTMYNDKISAVYFYPGDMSDTAIMTDIRNGSSAAYARTNASSGGIKVNLPDIMVDKDSNKLVNVKVALKGSDLSGYGNILSLEVTATAGTQNSGEGYGFTEDLGSNNLILYDNINTADANNVIINGIQTIREVKLSGTYGDVSSSSAPFANLYSVLPIRDADKVTIANDTSTFRKYGLTLSNGKLYGTLSAASDGTSDNAVSFSYKSNNKNAGTAYIKIKIDKADSSITTAPTANSLTYTGSAQTLTTSGSCNGGTLYYRLYSYQSNTASSATVYNNSYSTTKPTGTAAGTYVVQYYVMGDSNHNDTGVSSVTVTIARADFTATVSIDGYTYGGTKSTPSVSNNPGGASVTYYGRSTSTGAATAWSSVTSTTYNVGTRYCYAVIAETNNYSSYTTANTSFTISKGASSVTTSPTANSLTYSGSAQTLTTVGSCSGGTLYYRLYSYKSNTASSATTYNNSYSTTRPTGTDAGTYVVQYYVAGDSNHNNTGVSTVTVTISRASFTATVSISGYTYGGTKSTPSVSNNPGGGTVTYYGRSTSSGTATAWSSVTSTTYNAGTRYCYAVIAATNNYSSYTTSNASFTISKADFTATVSISGYTYGGTKSTPSVSNNPGSGTVTYYGRSTSSGTATAWSSVTSTTYDAGTRYCYAVIAATTNYNSYTTANTSFTISKASQSAPTTLTASIDDSLNVTLTATGSGKTTLEYRISTSSSYQTSNVFSGLSEENTYTFYARYAATSNYNASSTKSVSVSTSVFTWSGTTITGVTDYGKTKQVLEVPSKTTAINSTAFSSCTNLLGIYVDNTNKSLSGAPWGMPSGSANNCLWKDDYRWSSDGKTITLLEMTRTKMQQSKVIYIPSTCQRVIEGSFSNGNYNWFSQADYYAPVIIAEGVTIIGKQSFYKDTGLHNTVYLPSTITFIGAEQFYIPNSKNYTLNVYINKPNGSVSGAPWVTGNTERASSTNYVDIHWNDGSITSSYDERSTTPTTISAEMLSVNMMNKALPNMAETIAATESPYVDSFISDKISEDESKITEGKELMPVETIIPEETPDVTDTPFPTTSESPHPDETPSSSDIPECSPEPSAEPSPIALQNPEMTASPTPEASSEPNETPIASTTPSVIPTALPLPSATSTPMPTPTPTPTPSHTPTPMPTHTSTASPVPTESPAQMTENSHDDVWDSSLLTDNTALKKILLGVRGVMPG